MAIVSSVIVEDARQIDGRRYIRERHTDQIGQVYEFTYLCPAGFNAAVALAARVPIINADLIVNEVSANVSDVLANGSLASPSLVYSTPAQNFLGLRLAYATATRTDVIMIGDFLDTLTNGQLATAFGITTGQAATLRTNKLDPAAALATSIRAAAGQ